MRNIEASPVRTFSLSDIDGMTHTHLHLPQLFSQISRCLSHCFWAYKTKRTWMSAGWLQRCTTRTKDESTGAKKKKVKPRRETRSRWRQASTNPFLTESESTENVAAKIKYFNAKDTDECWTCVNCSVPFTNDEDRVIECDDCEGHYCITSIEMTLAEYDVMQRPDWVWRCPDCARLKQ